MKTLVAEITTILTLIAIAFLLISPLFFLIWLIIYLLKQKNRRNRHKPSSSPYSFLNKLSFHLKSLIQSPEKFSFTKGAYGESIVNQIISSLSKEYRYFHNVYVPLSNNRGYVQIDHILICPYGIFVIETKNYKGLIFGKLNERHWTQVLHGTKGATLTYQIYNPVMQNDAHITVLKHYLGFYEPNIFQSLITFSDTSEFKTDDLIHSPFIVYFSQLKKTIKQQKQSKLSLKQIKHATQLLEKLTNLDAATLKQIAQQHKTYVNKKKQQS